MRKVGRLVARLVAARAEAVGLQRRLNDAWRARQGGMRLWDGFQVQLVLLPPGSGAPVYRLELWRGDYAEGAAAHILDVGLRYVATTVQPRAA